MFSATYAAKSDLAPMVMWVSFIASLDLAADTSNLHNVVRVSRADPEAAEAAKASLAVHYLARLEEGFRITYLGPFVTSGSAVLGS